MQSVKQAQSGLRIVCLKSGDPSYFGRVSPEAVAARAAGIPLEIVSGISATSDAAASDMEMSVGPSEALGGVKRLATR